MAKYVIIEITGTNLTNFLTFEESQITEVGAMLFDLSESEKISIRKFTIDDNDLSGAFSNFLTDHPGAFPSSFPIANIQLAINNIRKIRQMEEVVKGTYYKLDSTRLVCGSVIKYGLDDAYAILKREVDDNELYRPFFNKLKALYDKPGRNKPEVHSIQASSSVVIENFVAEARLSNVGDTVIEVSEGIAEEKNPTVLVPGETMIVPKTAASLFIKNKSSEDEAFYSLRMK